MDEAVVRHLDHKDRVEGCRADLIERAEDGDAPERRSVEAEGAMRAPCMGGELGERVWTTPDDHDVV